jgi:hypothetical protein
MLNKSIICSMTARHPTQVLVHHATILEMNVGSYRRREALDRKRGRGRPATHVTIKKTENAESD